MRGVGFSVYYVTIYLSRKTSYPSIFADVVKQFTSRHILHDHEEICGCTDHLIPATQTIHTPVSNLELHMYNLELFDISHGQHAFP